MVIKGNKMMVIEPIFVYVEGTKLIAEYGHKQQVTFSFSRKAEASEAFEKVVTAYKYKHEVVDLV